MVLSQQLHNLSSSAPVEQLDQQNLKMEVIYSAHISTIIGK